MALKGLDIFKLSPKKNCKECGCPTCMAFCMKVAQGALELSKCPYFAPEAIEKLTEATAPAMKTVKLGDDISLGGETVLFRHEKTFVNRNRFAVSVNGKMSDEMLEETLLNAKKVDYERIGEREYVEFISVGCDCGDHSESAVRQAMQTGRRLILDCACADCARIALELTRGKNPILNGANAENYEKFNELAKEFGAVLAVRGENLSDLHDTAAKLEALGNKNFLLDITGRTLKETFANAVLVRRSAIRVSR